VLRQAINPHSGRTLYGQPVPTWQRVFEVISIASSGGPCLVDCLDLTNALDR
jgi:hypothetical protein